MNKKSAALALALMLLLTGCTVKKAASDLALRTPTPTVSATVTETPTPEPTVTPSPSFEPTLTPTVSPSQTHISTATRKPSATKKPTSKSTKKPTPKPTKTPTPIYDESSAVKINVVGDIMCHSNLITASKVSGSKYDFKPWFEDFKGILSNGDLVIANLETTLNGRSNSNYAGYPNFNTPAAILEGLKYAGVNMVLTANNHSFDTKYSGVKNTLAELNAAGLAHTGTYTNKKDYDTPFIKEINGIKIGILNYTYSTNGMASTIPSDVRPYAIRYLDYNNPKKIYDDIKNIRKKGAELVIVAPHWGEEYQSTPSSAQRNLAQNLLEHGADLIIGGHPHCVQRTSKRTVTTVDGETKDCIVTYSMGNFIADQRKIEKKITETGYMLSVTAVRDTVTGKVHLRDASMTPSWIYRYTKNGKYAYRILPLGKYATKAKESWMDSASYTEMKKEWKRINDLLGSEGIRINKE